MSVENIAENVSNGSHVAEHAHSSGPHIAIAAEKLGEFFGLPITNTLIMSWFVMIVLVVLAIYLNKKLSINKPGKLQSLFEMIFEFALNFIEEVFGSRRMALTFFPLLMTMFLFIGLANWLEFIPGVGPSLTFTTGEGEVQPFLRSMNTDLNVTIALALIAFVVIEITGMKYLGFFSYMKKFINFSSPLNFFVGIIELISELARLVAFSFRLFGNIFAGEVLIAVATFFLSFLVPVPLMMFELFVGFIQAAVFALLTLFFIKIAITKPEH